MAGGPKMIPPIRPKAKKTAAATRVEVERVEDSL